MATYGYLDLYIVRHGLTTWNREKKYLGWTNQPLIETEKHQLALLKSHFATVSFDTCYSSDLIRCSDTLSYLYPTNDAHLDDRLRELNFGDWEGKTYEMLKDNQHYQKWLPNWETISPPNGETGIAFQTRIQSFLIDSLKSFYPHENRERVLIVTHGGVIRYIVSLFIREFSFWEVPIKNNSGYILHLKKNEKGGWECYSWLEVPTQVNENT